MLFLTPTYPTAVLLGLRIIIQRVMILQKKQLELLIFNQGIPISSALSKQNFILKFQDKICFENILFVSKSLYNLTVSVSVYTVQFSLRSTWNLKSYTG